MIEIWVAPQWLWPDVLRILICHSADSRSLIDGKFSHYLPRGPPFGRFEHSGDEEINVDEEDDGIKKTSSKQDLNLDIQQNQEDKKPRCTRDILFVHRWLVHRD